MNSIHFADRQSELFPKLGYSRCHRDQLRRYFRRLRQCVEAFAQLEQRIRPRTRVTRPVDEVTHGKQHPRSIARAAVERATLLGLSGSTGYSTGPHAQQLSLGF